MSQRTSIERQEFCKRTGATLCWNERQFFVTVGGKTTPYFDEASDAIDAAMDAERSNEGR